MTKPAILLIGGLDPQGAAGLTADIQTVNQLGGHPVPLVTCLTEQTANGITAINALSAANFAAQLGCCTADFPIAAVKIGLLPNAEIASLVADWLRSQSLPVVLDPVLAASSGGKHTGQPVIKVIQEQLLPQVSLLTPNLPELQLLAGTGSKQQQIARLREQGLAACLLKGGHESGELSTDIYQDGHEQFYVTTPRFHYTVRGTGCALATAIVSFLANQYDLREAVVLARSYLNQNYQKAEKLGPYRLLQHQPLKLSRAVLPAVNSTPYAIGQTYSFADCPQLGIYPVVDCVDWLTKCFEQGIRTIQLRIKSNDVEFTAAQITKAVAIARQYPDSRLFINDHWPQAIAAGAYGVHLGQEDLYNADLQAICSAGLRLGISTHSYWELARALTVNPSYIALGPIYNTDSKQMPWQPQGHAKVTEWLQILGDMPLVAIGGIDLPRAKALKKTGVGSVAMISAITKATDYQMVCRDLLALWPETANSPSSLDQTVQRVSM